MRTLLKVWDWAVSYAAKRGGEWGVILPKEAEERIAALREVPSFIKLHHFGALRGLDELRDVRGLIIVGRPMASPGEVERIAGALSGRAAEHVKGDWYPAELVQLRARDGGVTTVEADRHPDALAEAVRVAIAETELIQAAGRVRGVNRTKADPVEVVLLTNVPVPGLVPDELRQFEGPSIDDEMLSQFGAVLESSGDMATVAGTTARAMLVARQRCTDPYKIYLYGNVHLCTVEYQRAGPRFSRHRVTYDRRRIPNIKAWLTDRLGPLAWFEAEPVQAAEPIPIAPVNSTPDEQPVVASPRRACQKIVDTSGAGPVKRCGIPIDDGRDYCPVHRAAYARTLLGPVSIRDLLPTINMTRLGKPRVDWEAVYEVMQAAAPGAVASSSGDGSEVFICSGIGVPEGRRERSVA